MRSQARMEQMGTRPLVETGGLALLLIAILVAPVAAEELPVVTLGVLVDGESERMESLLDTFTTEILALTRQEIDLRIPEGKLVIADWTRVGIETDLERLLGDPEVDVVLALGAISAHVAAHRGAYPKPLIAPFAVDANVQGFPFDPQTGGSGVHNFTYANILAPTLRDIQKFLEIDPFIRRLAVILQPALHEAMPELGEASLAQLEELGIEAVRVPARATPEETVAAIPSDVDAVYVLPLMRFGDDDIARLADGLKQRRLPSFSMYGRREVELGLLACLRTEEFLPRLARRMALSLQQVLLGEESGAIPVTFLENPRAVINMRTVREVGAFPSIRATFGAELLHQEQVEGVPLLRLTDAVIWAVDANLDLAAFDRQVAAGRQSVAEAKGLVRPRVTASSLASAIDADRAAASFGSQPERSFDASLALDQIIYAEPVFANVTIQNRLQESLEVQREQLRLDIVREAATAYLDVLRAHGIFEIQHENYLVTLKNRDLAEIRQRIGAAGASEVYRWQSAIATAEGEREAARRVVEIAKVNLNRVLDRPQNTKFIPEDVDHFSDIFMSGDIRTWQYVYSLPGYEIYIEFMVGEGLERSFELAAIDAAIAAAERSLVAARRQLYIPRFSLRAEISEVFSKSGVGSDGIDLPIPVDLPSVDDTSWSVGLFGSLPLYTGGSSRAASRRAQEELYQLQIEREAVADRIEQRIRSALHLAAASWFSIDLSYVAADAASKSLELVTESYATGAVSITELLDAQAAALRASEAESNAVYDFLIDLMEVERAVSSFDFFQTVPERDAFYRRVHDFMTERGVRPLPEDMARRSLIR